MAPAGRVAVLAARDALISAVARPVILARDDNDSKKAVFKGKPHGVLDPHDINNAGFFALFALIGVAFVITAIWFFFWAKNGGFHFKENDWDDYKSTVLRRKGPNGTLLSGVTPTTDLGGGSVYKDYGGDHDDGTTVVTETTALSGITAGASDLAAREKRRYKQEKRERDRDRRRRKSKGSEKGGDDKQSRRVGSRRVSGSGDGGGGGGGVTDEAAEKAAQKELRNYRHERPARVGGLNKQADGSGWDGSARGTEASSAVSASEAAPAAAASSRTKQPAIRKVYSTTASTAASRETERIRGEARRLREQGRSARRDFSFQRAGGAESALSESLLESSRGASRGDDGDGDDGDLGTKSYHHPMPELRELGQGRHGGDDGDRDKDRDKDRDRDRDNKERERERDRDRRRERGNREREERRARRGGHRRGGTGEGEA